MKRVPLTRDLFAIVDDEDFAYINSHKWYAHICGNNIYAARRDETKSLVLMHRVINRTPYGVVTDHRDGDGLNNRRSNLRDATSSQNQMNRRAARGATSPLKGVFHTGNGRKNCWRAHIRLNGRGVHLGVFATEGEAHAAYVARASLEFGEFFCAGRGE